MAFFVYRLAGAGPAVDLHHTTGRHLELGRASATAERCEGPERGVLKEQAKPKAGRGRRTALRDDSG